ncbi:MAG: MBL fold metallo-hydrolase [Sedimenticola sp.]|nr:MBL fold metallo-hydrolase [Sedimenticola sp.]
MPQTAWHHHNVRSRLAMGLFRFLCAGLVLLCLSFSVAAQDMQLQKVAENVYAVVGELGNRTPENLGNNATFGLVVTPEGAVLIDPGGSYQGAQRLHRVIRQVTDQPVVAVINSGGQDHRWLGNGYFREQGARIIASEAAVQDQKARVRDQLILLNNLVGEAGLKGTEPVYADETFSESLILTLDETRIEIVHAGPAHTPGDSFVWLPQKRVLFSGDIVYTGRMLGVGAQSSSASWISVYETMAAYTPDVLVPGHGQPGPLDRARADTYDYLVFLRKRVREFFDAGGDIASIGSLDQSRFSYLENFDTLAGRNAQRVYTEIEWE